METKIGPLEVQEIKEAQLMWIKSVQREAFPAVICYLTAGQPVGTKSRLRTLTPFLDESDILRVGGRIDGVAICYDAKHPMIIPQDHQLCLAPCKGIRNPESNIFLPLEFEIQGFGIRNPVFGIRNPTRGIRNPTSSITLESRS